MARRSVGVRYARWMVVCILILDIIGTVVAWDFIRKQEIENANGRFEAYRGRAKLAITKRLLDHELVLRGGLGFFMGSHNVERREWREYIAALSLPENFPGIQGVGFSKWIDPDDRDAHIAQVRAEGFPEYHIWPEGTPALGASETLTRPGYTSIVYLEPFVKRNLRAFGYDMFSEPVRREAMSRSRDLGVPSISGKVRLVQETETGIQHGILMYVPYYRRNARVETVEDRRAALVGFVYSPYRMNDLMSGILGDMIQDIDLEIYDGTRMIPETLLYDADRVCSLTDTTFRPLFTSTTDIKAYGRNWTVHFRSLPAFAAGLDRRRSIMALILGLSITLFLCAHLVHEGRQQKRIERLVDILEATPDIVENATPTGRILYMNESARTMLGVRPDEDVSRMRISDFHSPATTEMLTGRVIPTAMSEGFWRGETEYLSRAGRTIPTSTVVIAHKTRAGKIEYISTLSRDISDQKSAEARLKLLQQQLQHSDKISALGRMIAHEINNPLTGILGYAELISSSSDLAACKADVEAISAEARRCSKIVQSMLTFARRHDPQKTACRLNRIVVDAVDMYSYNLKQDDIDLAIDLDSTMPMTMADPDQMKQVFLNIIQNAHHALKDVAGPRRLKISGRLGKEDTQVFTFEDTGPGIPKDHQVRIFDPFFTTKEVGKGTGLGLSVSYGIVQEHGGAIFVESSEGRKTTFTVQMPHIPASPLTEIDEPYSESPARSAAGTPADVGDIGTWGVGDAEPADVGDIGTWGVGRSCAIPGARDTSSIRSVGDAEPAHILVVDDEKSIRTVLGRYLENAGYRITTAASVDDAIRCLNKDAYDTLIVDLKMPGKDGAVFYEHIALNRPKLLDRFILSTGDTVSPSTQEFISRTGVTVIEKPYNLPDVQRRIAELLNPTPEALIRPVSETPALGASETLIRPVSETPALGASETLIRPVSETPALGASETR